MFQNWRSDHSIVKFRNTLGGSDQTFTLNIADIQLLKKRTFVE